MPFDLRANPPRQRGLRGSYGRDLREHPVQSLERALRNLVHSLPTKNPRSALAGPARELIQKARLAPARQRLEQHEPRPAFSDGFDRAFQRGQLALPADERRIRKGAPAIAKSDDDRRLPNAALKLALDLFEVEHRRFRRLIAVARILSQQVLCDLAERVWDLRANRTKLGWLGDDMPAQHLADARSLEGWPAREALEEDDPGGIEVRALVDFVVQQPCLLRRDISRCLDGQVADRGAEPPAAGEPEIDEHRFFQRRVGVDDHVRWLDISMEHIPIVRFPQCGQHATADGDRVFNRQQALAQALFECHPRDEGRDQEEQIVVAADFQYGGDERTLRLAQDVRLVLQPHLSAERDGRRRRGLDDDLPSLLEVGPEEGHDALVFLEAPKRAEALTENAVRGGGFAHLSA